MSLTYFFLLFKELSEIAALTLVTSLKAYDGMLRKINCPFEA